MSRQDPASFALRLGRIEPVGQSFDILPGQSLLQALESGGLDWPSSCRNGMCRTCIGRLDSGQVSYSVDWPGLSQEELQDGSVLPCVAHAQTDVVLRRAE